MGIEECDACVYGGGREGSGAAAAAQLCSPQRPMPLQPEQPLEWQSGEPTGGGDSFPAPPIMLEVSATSSAPQGTLRVCAGEMLPACVVRRGLGSPPQHR